MEGQYAYTTNPLTEDGKPIKHLICNGTNIFNDLIDPDTICQYTGLTDKNGKKIWENDILRYSYDYDGSPFLKDGEEIKYRVGAVFWSEWRGSWAVCGRGNKNAPITMFLNIIGIQIERKLSETFLTI